MAIPLPEMPCEYPIQCQHQTNPQLRNATVSGREVSTLLRRAYKLLLLHLLLCQSFGYSGNASVVLKLTRLNVTSQHFALEVFLVAVPKQSCFSVQWRGARTQKCQHFCPSSQNNSMQLTYSAPPTNSEYSAAHSPYSAPRSKLPPYPVHPASEYQGKCGRSCRRLGGRSAS